MCDILLPHTGSFVILYTTYLDQKNVWQELEGDKKSCIIFCVFINQTITMTKIKMLSLRC